TWRACVAIRLQIDHGGHLLFGLPGTTRKHGAAPGMACRLHHGSGRRELIRKTAMNTALGTEARCKQGPGKPPVIFACPFGLVNRPWRSKNTQSLAPANRGKPAKGSRALGPGALVVILAKGMLLGKQIAFTQHGDAG